MITRKTYNYDYAPGLAAYGLQGLDGSTGKHANNLFYTNFDLSGTVPSEFTAQLVSLYVPIKGSTTPTDRAYQVGDYFFQTDGRIFELTAFNASKTDGTAVALVGRIQIDAASVSDKVKYRDDRLLLNSSTYEGFDILVVDKDTSVNNDAAMNIASDETDEDNNINFIQMSAIDINNLTNSDLRIYYSTIDQAYHLESSYPIVINASDIKVSNDSPSADYDDYSQIVTNLFPLTRFKQYCNACTWGYSSTNLTITMSSDAFTKLLSIKANLICKAYNSTGLSIYSLNDTTKVSWDTTDKKVIITNISNTPNAVSLMYNMEIFISKA